MPLDATQEWRDQNSDILFPFAEGCDVPTDLISDLKFFYDRVTQEDVYLSSLDLIDDTTYELEFRYVSNSEIAISGSAIKNTPSKVITIWGENNESLVMFAPGASWFDSSWNVSGWPMVFAPEDSLLEKQVVTSGPRLLNRIIKHDDTSSRSSWRKECIHSILAGSGFILTPELEDGVEVIDVSADMDYFFRGVISEDEEDGILTINNVPPTKDGAFYIPGTDCMSNSELPLIQGVIQDNAIQVHSSCVPCCSCSSYQSVSKAIERRSLKLKEICEDAEAILQGSILEYEAAVSNTSSAPITKVSVEKVSRTKVNMILHNACIFPMYGVVGLRTISSGGKAFSIGGATFSSLSSVSSLPGLPSTSLYSIYGEYIGSAAGGGTPSDRIPIGDTGNVGCTTEIDPGGSIKFEIVWTNPPPAPNNDLRVPDESTVFIVESNGIIGHNKMYGCMKSIFKFAITSVNPEDYPEPCNVDDSVLHQVSVIQDI